MKLASSFAVPASPDVAFPLFFDAATMRGCIPGCEELTLDSPDTYRGRLVNEIAHVRFNAGFSAEIVSSDPPHEVRALLSGEDRRLGSSIKIDAVLTIKPDGDEGSLVEYQMELALWGKLGRLGESIVKRRTQEVERQFADAFTEACRYGGTPPEQSPEVAAEPLTPSNAAAAEVEKSTDRRQRVLLASGLLLGVALVLRHVVRSR